MVLGNSLLGATPALLKQGIPNSAFELIEGDDKKICSEYKKKNKTLRAGQLSLFTEDLQPWDRLGDLATSIMQMENMGGDTVEEIHRKQDYYTQLVASSEYLNGRLWADAWCVAFVWKKTKEFAYPITEEIFRKIEQNPHNLASWMKDEIQRLAQQYQFFHWHLAFPDVFRVPAKDEIPENEQTGWSGGFDVVLGNPPWERIKIQEKEWFASRRPDIANAANAAQRRKMISALVHEAPELYKVFMEDQRQAMGESHIVRNSGRYPLCGRGDVNTYSIFADVTGQKAWPDRPNFAFTGIGQTLVSGWFSAFDLVALRFALSYPPRSMSPARSRIFGLLLCLVCSRLLQSKPETKPISSMSIFRQCCLSSSSFCDHLIASIYG